MPVQHSPSPRQTRSLARAQDTEDPYWKEQHHPERKEEGQKIKFIFRGVFGGSPGLPRTTFKGPGEDDGGEQEDSVEEEVSDGNEDVPAPLGASQGTGGPALAMSNNLNHPYCPSCSK
ncbi:hypothetical protein O181_017363 [Austropuccinia psidii MF-1]|uniref:Uncharacterized protein n=1 Tax=Austropuccinia psidii MF-1 TaxID=1389203 RepID=A0A9Q3C5Z4_9BASI|nr:hypothetical protein [Austropuccinia psidii MF-1]